jgi:polyisoprenoid-binding protein YceI
MKAVLFALALLTPFSARAQAAPAPDLAAGVYSLDRSHAKLTARMRVLGLYPYAVRFRRLDGGFRYDPADAAASQVTITVDPRSMTDATSVAGRRMLSLLEPDRFPTITFVARRMTLDGPHPKLVGELTLHGMTRPVTLDVAPRERAADDAGRAYVSGSGRISRSQFGMAALSGVVGDQIELIFDVAFTRD